MTEHNDTKLSWTDADLADAVHHAREAGMAQAQGQIAEAIALLVADAMGRLHETRVDSKRYPIVEAELAAFTRAWHTTQTPIKIDNLDDCNC